MGCLKSKPKDKEPGKEEPKYSWSNREKINPSDYIIENDKNSNWIKKPDTINGQQFIIQNCQNVNICLFDYINTITIDDCSNCSIIVGPTQTSVVLRNCINCHIISASQQFRCRDCKNLIVFLYCTTQPAIESCTNISFACYSFYYKQLKDQFKRANLSLFNNNWYNIYDFTINEEEHHWTFLPPSCTAADYFSKFNFFNDESIDFSFDPNLSIVPKTTGMSPNIGSNDSETCLVMIHPDNQLNDKAMSFIRDMQQQQNNSIINLIKTNEFVATKELEKILKVNLECGQTYIILECEGENCTERINEIIKRKPGFCVFNNIELFIEQIFNKTD